MPSSYYSSTFSASPLRAINHTFALTTGRAAILVHYEELAGSSSAGWTFIPPADATEKGTRLREVDYRSVGGTVQPLGFDRDCRSNQVGRVVCWEVKDVDRVTVFDEQSVGVGSMFH